MKRNGFSLMEMMVVLLIVSVIAAVTAPMVNKKMASKTNESSCYWTPIGQSIGFNIKGENKTVVIGDKGSGDKSRLSIYTKDTVTGYNHMPQIKLSYINPATKIASNTKLMTTFSSIALNNFDETVYSNSVVIGIDSKANKDSVAIGKGANGNISAIAIGMDAQSTALSSIAIGKHARVIPTDIDAKAASIALGDSATATNSFAIAIGNEAMAGSTDAKDTIAIGRNAIANGNNSIAIASGNGEIAGNNKASVTASGDHSIAIGHYARAIDNYSLAIGNRTTAAGEYSVAIGVDSSANAEKSCAIGYNARATRSNEIAIGNDESTVHIKGDLIVEGDVLLGYYNSSRVLVRAASATGNNNSYLSVATHNGGFDATWVHDGSTHKAAGKTIKEIEKENFKDFWDDKERGLDLSDRRLKNVGESFKGGLDEIRKLEVFNYTFKKDESKTPRVGVMAQDLQKIFPKAVIKGEDGFLRIRMEDMFYAMVNAIKELANKFDLTDKRISELEKENKELKKIIKDLDERLSKLEK